jgi:predicted alpha/beta hydrolase family esterase
MRPTDKQPLRMVTSLSAVNASSSTMACWWPGLPSLGKRSAPVKPKTPHHVLFIQGGGHGAHDLWDDKLVVSLGRNLGPDYRIGYPRMPNEADPHYVLWKAALKQELGKLNAGAILIGHSIGGTILINVLAEGQADRTPSGIFVISAPFVGMGGWPSEDIRPKSDLGASLPADVPVYLYHGSQDESVPFTHVDLYAKAIPQAVVRRLAGRDHQLNNDLSDVAADIRLRTDTG